MGRVIISLVCGLLSNKLVAKGTVLTSKPTSPALEFVECAVRMIPTLFSPQRSIPEKNVDGSERIILGGGGTVERKTMVDL